MEFSRYPMANAATDATPPVNTKYNPALSHGVDVKRDYRKTSVGV
jgi:hypothetical protein